ncbi:MAG: alkaline phosphatase family protein [Anaerolineae bacterium]
MQSTIPPISGPAWSSVITGRSPGMTGLYDFLSRKAGTYHFVPINSRMRDGRSFWQMLGDWGKRVGVLNVPVTYPVEPVNGFMVSGWMTPYHARDFTYPRALAEELGRELGDYRLYPAATYSERRREAFFEEMDAVLRARIQATSYLMSTRSWDFFISVIYETDLMEHQLWHYIDPTHPRYDADEVARYGNPLLRFFQGVDRGIGQFVEQAGEDVTVIVMSDHGMGAVHRFVFLNCWLLDEGFLQLKRDPATWAKSLALKSGLDLVRVHRLADWLNLSKDAEYKVMYTQDRLLKMAFLSFNNVDWSRSVAYSYGRGIGPIYLNVRGREPHGIVEPGEEYQRIRQEIAQRALAYRHPDTGEPMVREVLWPEAIYHGDHVQEAPDLILVPAQETDHFYGLSDFGSSQLYVPAYRYSAVHRRNAFVCLWGPYIQRGARLHPASLEDIAPTVFYAMDLPIPPDFEGRPLLEAFQPEYVAEHPARWQAPPGAPGPFRPLDAAYSEEEAAEVEARLRQLGYMG